VKIFLTGGAGNLGIALQKTFRANSIDCVSPLKEEVNVVESEKVQNYIKKTRPDIVVHAAAMTDVRQCETNWKNAELVNINGTYNIAIACKSINCKMIYISTACVFDGEHAPFVESSKPGPKNFYALTKYTAEQVVKNINPRHLIIRTNFVPRAKWPYPKAFTDRFGTYLFADDLSDAITSVMNLEIEGIVHICGDKRMSMFELAKITTPEVEPMTLDDYKGPPLTKDMSLSSERIEPFELTI
jgi:dTDP-4-dehydrorhamnose reductase